MSTINSIFKYLDNNNVSYKYYKNINLNDGLTFASIKNIIDDGIYYFEEAEDFINYNVKNSLVITNQVVDSNLNNIIVVENPQLIHYKLSSLSAEKINYSISESAKVSKEANIGKNVFIGENCVIGNCIIEDNVIIKHNVVVEGKVLIKSGSFIDSNSVIGAVGLAWIWDNDGARVIQPQIGGVIIEEDCHIGTDVTIVRGSLSESTIIGQGTVIAHGTKIGHGCIIGKNVHMANNVSLAGNAIIGDQCFLGSACIVSSNVKVYENNIVGAGSLVTKIFKENFVTLAGIPAKIIGTNNFNHKPKGVPKPYKK